MSSCTDDSNSSGDAPTQNPPAALPDDIVSTITAHNYANQAVPNYITKDNTRGNTITNAGAALGRVLFYDRQLSVDGSISCSSCHQQSAGFGDPMTLSTGVNGETPRQSMRLINSRFGTESRFFWDERAASLEEQTTQPIKDHLEMGFNGSDGDPSIYDLMDRLSANENYQSLFNEAFGSTEITESKMQDALAQFIRSIQSFDSKYDLGRQQVNNDAANFPNYTASENLGKQLFMTPPQMTRGTANRVGGGLGCNGCHRAPEFDIDPNSRNNGVIAATHGNEVELDITRSPSLRDMFDASGNLHTPLMHTGSFSTIDQVIDHYNNITTNSNLDRRLSGGNNGQQLNITSQEREALTDFLKTLTGSEVYRDEKWSDPF